MSELYDPFPSCFLAWLRIWQSPWVSMHPSWEVCVPEEWKKQGSWRREQFPSECMRSVFSIEDSIPSEPGEALQYWLMMNDKARSYALKLAAEIVIPEIGRADLEHDDIKWGRHIAKALTPGKWSVASWKLLLVEQVGLLLMRQWVSPITWQRLRLFYDKGLVDSLSVEPFLELPEKRLNQLWHAVMWRVSQLQSVNQSLDDHAADTGKE